MPVARSAERFAVRRLLETYAGLAGRRAHLLAPLLAGGAPTQWQHYPPEDAIDRESGYQWFYHSHAPEDRACVTEHGHLHLFARRRIWGHRMRSSRERAFAAMDYSSNAEAHTCHLLAIGLNDKGIPQSLFTVSSWVTGDLMLSADVTMSLLDRLQLDTGYAEVDAVIRCINQLFSREIQTLLAKRDEVLLSRKVAGTPWKEKVEILSSMDIDVDARLSQFEV